MYNGKNPVGIYSKETDPEYSWSV